MFEIFYETFDFLVGGTDRVIEKSREREEKEREKKRQG